MLIEQPAAPGGRKTKSAADARPIWNARTMLDPETTVHPLKQAARVGRAQLMEKWLISHDLLPSRARGGAPCPSRPHDLPERFIPASAGSTYGGNGGTLCGPVHPRERGEHGGSGNTMPLRIGSSPRARGAPM